MHARASNPHFCVFSRREALNPRNWAITVAGASGCLLPASYHPKTSLGTMMLTPHLRVDMGLRKIGMGAYMGKKAYVRKGKESV
jgi:hypothetical protein